MAKIYERNPDTGEIRSREMHEPTKAQQAISRSEILDEIWAANKTLKDGEWYVRLSDVCAILGEEYARQEQ
jgi:prophage antirepressor-like protein